MGMKKYRPVVLIILDGWGLSPSWGGNAITINNPKNIDWLWRNFPHKILQALGAIEYGNVVGESRLGHLMIGAGRPVASFHTQINRQIKNAKFYKNPALVGAFEHAKKNNSAVHLMGLISDGGVHADISHLVALLEMAHRQNFERVYIDAITDGVDSGPTESLKFIGHIYNKIRALSLGQFSSVGGRAFAMDRDEHWDKIRKYYDCVSAGKGVLYDKIEQAISANYRQDRADEFIAPSPIRGQNKKIHPITKNDAVIFFNFREDRAKQLSEVFLAPGFRKFLWHPQRIANLYFCTFIGYEKNLRAKIAFESDKYPNNLSQYLSQLHLRQLKIAESEKLSHVTTFFNGGEEGKLPGEERKIISSPNVSSYVQKPEMSAEEISQTALKAIKSKKYDFILINFANVDMLAHTGDILAVGKAVQILDDLVAKITKENLKTGGATIISADHGNAEQMISINQKVLGERESVHTLNPVPFILVTPEDRKNLIKSSITFSPNALEKIIEAKETLASIAPTILELMGAPKPKEMINHSLIGRLE